MIAISVFYSFVIRPYQKDQPLRQCIKDSKTAIDGAKERMHKARIEGKIEEKEENLFKIKSVTILDELIADCNKKY